MAHSTTVSSVTPISDIFYYSIPHLSRRAETSLSYTSPLPLLSPVSNTSFEESHISLAYIINTHHPSDPDAKHRRKRSHRRPAPPCANHFRQFQVFIDRKKPRQLVRERNTQRLRFWFLFVVVVEESCPLEPYPRDDHHGRKQPPRF